MISSGPVELIRERLDIVDLVREYIPSLKKSGKSYKACCPFHSEKTPSFYVDPAKQMFYCFGCQEGGDIFSFVMKIENMSFNEAGEKLAQKAGIMWKQSSALTSQEKEKLEIKKALDLAKAFYKKQLHTTAGKKGLEYLTKRNFSKETIEKFELGFASEKRDLFVQTAMKRGFSGDILARAGLMVNSPQGQRDYFFGRVMFPIINHRNETVGFGGRVLEKKEPKYLNSPETRVFSKSRVLFGLGQAAQAIRRSEKALLLEGYTDVIACHQAGFENAVAPLGTSFTHEHAKLLKRYCNEVIVLFDPDTAGLNAALRATFILMEAGLFVKVAKLGNNLDPDEFISKFGRESFERVINEATDLIGFQTELILSKLEKPLSAQDKSNCAKDLMETVARQPDPVVKSEWIKYVSQKLNIDEQILLNLSSGRRTLAKYAQEEEVKKQENFDDIPVTEWDLLKWLLKFPDFCEKCDCIEKEEYKSERIRNIIEKLSHLVNNGVKEESLTSALIDELPGERNLISRLSVEPLPKNFDCETDILQVIKRIKIEFLKRQLAVIEGKIKRLGAGNVPTELLKEQIRLISQLKKSPLTKE
jgi:DNA primase